MRKSNYGVMEKISNVKFVIKTKLFFPSARMFRFPIVIRGKHYMDFGSNLTTGYRCRFEVNGVHKEKKLIFGKNVNIGDSVRISCATGIKLGNNVLIGSRVLIIDNSHGNYSGKNQDSPDIPPNERNLMVSPICISDNVWIGENSVIQQGVTIGAGSIIAANSVVTKSLPENIIAAGAPANIVKVYNQESNEWRKIK